jgi:hypothetical protein
MTENTPPGSPKTQQMSLQVGRSENGMVVIARDQKPVVIAPPHYALQIAAALTKHASILIAGTAMIDDAIEQALAQPSPLISKLPPPDEDSNLDNYD